ncbi:hypothetical protein [Microvirga alba]|uniref:ASCH domain-containing protein n=1 Tax=Microvirga alba TaxID=2791025 RepID=A0A931BSH5_9HYPH|nr:hypothetical protein [Microvirga alba]MBF9233969.1 hypothetical protein [Microvirga alba]
MGDRSILFSGPMVRALLDGRKTQTRGILKPQPAEWQAKVIDISKPFFCEEEGGWGQVETIWSGPLVPGMCEPEREEWRPLKGLRFAVGDRLWVRENIALPRNWVKYGPVYYAADKHFFMNQTFDVERLRPSIHMPRWASRLTLIVTDVRVQRLQDISEEDAFAEGAPWEDCWPTYRQSFEALWESINGADAWEANPWVAAYTFTVHRCNIDQMEPSP